MKKREELSNPGSCMSRAADEEMTFVLLSRDIAAPHAIRAWASERIRLGKNSWHDGQIVEALECALNMERQRNGKTLKPAQPSASEGERVEQVPADTLGPPNWAERAESHEHVIGSGIVALCREERGIVVRDFSGLTRLPDRFPEGATVEIIARLLQTKGGADHE